MAWITINITKCKWNFIEMNEILERRGRRTSMKIFHFVLIGISELIIRTLTYTYSVRSYWPR